MRDAVVIGAGLAGLAATLRLAQAGASVTLVTRGIGGLQLGQGTIDILGYSPERADNPCEAAAQLGQSRPHHPYQHFTASTIGEACTWLKDLLGPDLLQGDATRNVLLPTAVGALRPTALYQPSMAAGIACNSPIAVIGLRRLKDFPAALIADNLNKQQGPDGGPIRARADWIDLEVRPDEADTSGLNHARYLDTDDGRKRFVAALKPLLRDGEVVALPAVLGINDTHAWRKIQDLLGHDVFEIPLQPPSVPGMRLNQALTAMVKDKARLLTGASVVGFETDGDRLTSVKVDSAGRGRTIEARAFILAAGGFESGAIEYDSYMRLGDTVLGLPVACPEGALLHGDFWGADQPLFLAGFDVDPTMRVLDAQGHSVYTNVYAAGGNLRGAMRWREKSGDGIALVSAVRAADSIIGSLS